MKIINIAKHVMDHADYKAQAEDSPDAQNRQLALEKLIQNTISIERRELDLYKLYASGPDFKQAFDLTSEGVVQPRKQSVRAFMACHRG